MRLCCLMIVTGIKSYRCFPEGWRWQQRLMRTLNQGGKIRKDGITKGVKGMTNKEKQVTIIDSIMGSGKTSWAIQYLYWKQSY